MKTKAELLLKVMESLKLTPVEEKARIPVKDLPLKPVKCLSCGKFIDYTEPSNVVFLCPVCKEGIIIRCKKCRRLGRTVKCPVCGTEFP